MIKIITLLTLVVFISLGINWLTINDGSVEFVWLGYQIKTNVSFLIFALLAFFFLVIFVLEILKSIFSLPQKAGKAYKNKQYNDSLKQIKIGYSAILSGDLDLAKKSSIKLLSAPKDNKHVNEMIDILSAKVALDEGSYITANQYYDKLLGSKKNNYFAVKGKLENAFKNGDVENAISLAKKAYKLKPKVKDGAHSVLELYKKSGKINEAEKFLRKYKNKHIIFKDKYNSIDIKKEFSELSYIKAEAILSSNNNDKNLGKALSYAKESFEHAEDKIKVTLLILRICKILKDERSAKKYVEKLWQISPDFECASNYLEMLSATTTVELNKKKQRAIDSLQNIKLDPEMEEMLKDKASDITLML